MASIQEQRHQQKATEEVTASAADATRLSDQRSPGARLWRNRNFNIFWTGQSLSVLGDSFALLAMPLLVFQATGSVVQMGLVTGAFSIGQIISGVISGVIVDRVDRRRLMILCDLLRLALYGSIPLVWLLVGPQLWLIYVVVTLGAMLGMTFEVAMITALVNLVDRDQIPDANARASASVSLAFVIGPALAGLLSSRLGPVASVAVDALSFGVSALSLSWIRLRRERAEREVESETRSLLGTLRRTRDDLIEGIRFLAGQPTLRAVTLLLTGLTFLMAGMMDLFIFHLKSDLHQSDNTVGLVIGLAGIGGIGGGLIAPWLRRRVGFGASWLGAGALASISCVLVGIAPSLWLIGLCAVGYFFGQILAGTNSYTLRQELTPDHLLGRVTATFWTINGALAPLGAATLTLLASRLGGSAAITIGGLLYLGLTAIGIFTPARKGHPEREVA